MKENLFTQTLYIQDELYDLEQINVISKGWDNRWKKMQSGNIQAKLWIYTTPLMNFSYVNYDKGIMIEGNHSKGSTILSFIRSNTTINLNNEKLEHYELVILKDAEEFTYLSSGANEIFTIAIEDKYFEQEFYNYFGVDINDLKKNNRILLDEKNTQNLIYKMKFWLEYFQNNDTKDLEYQNYLEIQNNLLSELFSLIVTQNKKNIKGSSYIKKAREILEENVDNIYSIKELLDELDINARTLQYHFKEQLGIAPKQYLQNLRLNAIHKELLTADPHTTVISDITLKYGFFHPSHFGAEYKKFFQETPTQTLHKK
jgi:AraC-like DNA-binding protein